MELFFLLLVAALPRLYLIFQRGFEISGPDITTFGLMAKHILEGHWMVYYYSQVYTGALKAYVSALYFLLLGTNLTSVYLACLTVYLGMLTAHYFWVRKVWGRQIAFLSGLWLAFSSWQITHYCVSTGGYVGAMLFGSLFMYFAATAQVNRRHRFLAGLFLGLALWTQPISILYPIALWISKRKSLGSSIQLELKRVLRHLFAVDSKFPIPIKLFFILGNTVILGYGLWSLTCMLIPKNMLRQFLPEIWILQTPFYIAKLKMAAFFMLFQGAIMFLWKQGAGKCREWILKRKETFFGLLLGYAPALLYIVMGKPYGTYSRLDDSGMIPFQNLHSHLSFVFREGLVESFGGFYPSAGSFGWKSMLPSTIALVWNLGFFGFALFYFFIKKKSHGPKAFPGYFLALLFGIYILSELEAHRYFRVGYQSAALVAGYGMLTLIKYRKKWGLLLITLGFMSQGVNEFWYIQSIPKQTSLQADYQEISKLMQERGVLGGYGENERLASALTFLSREKIKIIIYGAQGKHKVIYPPHERFVNKLERVAYVFKKESERRTPFEHRLAQMSWPYEVIRLNENDVYFCKRLPELKN
ncbi:MAG: hypothetical protein EXS63_05450 [Candidatus Omnitrophica bacterium]|nr:hypothetical protein [Candidatus Omnitrophota bacterium]